MRTLGVVFPVKNNLFFTRQILFSIRDHKVKNYDKVVVCVIDNDSTDGTAEYLSKWQLEPPVVGDSRFVVLNKENEGFGPACNQGIEQVLRFYPDADVVVMNNDMELLDGCFDALYETAYSQEDIGIVGGRLVFPDGRVQHAGAFLSLWGWGQHKGGGMQDADKFNQMEVEEVEYVTGALFHIKNSLLKVLPGFDERFNPVYFEEVDYCYAARALGYKTFYTPKAKAIHYENVTGKQVYGDLAAVNQRSHENQVKFYTKYDEKESVDDGNPNKILFTNRIYGEWSFCVVMRNLAKGLARNGVDVSIASEEYHQIGNMDDWEIKEMMNKPHDYWNRVVFRSAEGDHMYLMPPGKKRVGHTTGESTKIHGGWRNQLNHVDQVITNSTFFKNVLIDNGVKTPISIVPNSVDLKKFHQGIEKYPMEGLRSFNFLSMFHFGERKAPEVLLKAFAQEFKPNEDVTLTIHSLSMAWIMQQRGIALKDYVMNAIGGIDHAPIIITSDYIRESVVPHFMRNYDVNILATRGEGFGNSLIESAAFGMPSIITGHSGGLDFVTDDVGWKIDFKLVDIPLQAGLPYFKNYIGGQWAQPSIEDLMAKMRYAYEHRDEVKQKGANALLKVQNYSVESVGKLAKEVIFGMEKYG